MASQKNKLTVYQMRKETERQREESARMMLLADQRTRRGAIPDRILTYIPQKRHTEPRLQESAQAMGRAVKRLRLLDDRYPARGHEAREPYNTYPCGLARLLERHEEWIRAPKDWKPPSHNVRKQFASLARHLLTLYDPPDFMDAVWFCKRRGEGRRLQELFLHVGRGDNIRTAAGLPLELSRRAAHHLQEAPADLSVVQGLQWARWRAQNARPGLIEQLLASPMGEDVLHDKFWSSVIRFLIDNLMLDRTHVRPLVDYIHNQRYVDRQPYLQPDGLLVHPGPPHPGFSMKGRSADGLLRQMQCWHDEMGRVTRRGTKMAWVSCGILELLRQEGEGRNCTLFTIRELRSSSELQEEGRAMRHCVGSYSRSCASGNFAIFSLKRQTSKETQRLLTISVNIPARRINEARGRFNAMPTQEGMRMLRLWSQQSSLTMATYL